MIPGVEREARDIQWPEIQSGGSGLIENQAMGSIHFKRGEMQPRSMVRLEDWCDASGSARLQAYRFTLVTRADQR